MQEFCLKDSLAKNLAENPQQSCSPSFSVPISGNLVAICLGRLREAIDPVAEIQSPSIMGQVLIESPVREIAQWVMCLKQAAKKADV